MLNSLALITVAVATLASVRLTYQHWLIGIYSVLVLSAAHVFADYFPPLLDNPFNIYADDVVFAILFVAGLLKLLMDRRFSASRVFWLLFGLIILLSCFLGTRTYGVSAAGKDVRSFFYLFAGIIYFSSFPYTLSRFDGIRKGWQFIAVLFALVAIARWTAMMTGNSLGGPSEGLDGWLRLRVLTANATLVILQGALIWYASVLFSPRPAIHRRDHLTRRLLAAIALVPLVAVVVILQHRSVWVVGIVAFLMILQFEKDRAPVITMTLIIACVVMAAWTFLDLGRSTLGEALLQSTNAAITPDEQNTFLWRYNQWSMYYQGDYLSGVREWMIGKPFGAPYGSMFGLSEVSPHNWYVSIMLRMGVLGIATIVAILSLVLTSLWRLSASQVTTAYEAKMLLLLLVTQLVFSTVYGPGIEQCIFMGSAIGLVSTIPHKRPNPGKRLFQCPGVLGSPLK
jgi:hypothetical protein